MRLKFILCLAAAAMLLQGCVVLLAGAAVGAGAVVYTRGELKDVESASLESVHRATLSMLKDLALMPQSDIQDGLGAKIEARAVGGKTVTIKLKNQGAKLTEISIRVGMFGDETSSRQMLAKIQAKL